MSRQLSNTGDIHLPCLLWYSKIVAGLYKYPNLNDTCFFKGDKDKKNRLIIFPISNGVFFILSIISHINEQDLKQSNHKIYVCIWP